MIAVSVSAAAGLVWAGGNSKIVTNPTPALTATIEVTGNSGNCFSYHVDGKVKAAYRGHGANVLLVCNKYRDILNGGGSPIIVGQQNCDNQLTNDFFCGQTNVNACGNVSFDFTHCFSGAPGDTGPQFSNQYTCSFVVHVDDTKSPQSCSNKPAPIDGPVDDPNGSAPCSGGDYCPNSP